MNPSDPFVGQILDSRYRIDELIARGGMATVYRATDTRLGRVVALKILAGTLAADTAFVERFIHEARAAAALTHPNVVAVHDQGVWHEFPFLIMEYVSGHTVRQALQQHGPFTSAHALEIVQSVLLGLSAAHDAGFVHRDIKPENILITSDGHVKVTDFGLARVMDAAPVDTKTGAVLLGTMAYLSPEQVQQQQIDQRSDVYSTGIMLFELITGSVPFSGHSALDVAFMHVNKEVPPPSTQQPDVPPAVDHLVMTATRKLPSDRFQSARSFHEAITRATHAVPAAEALTSVLPIANTLILERTQHPGVNGEKSTIQSNDELATGQQAKNTAVATKISKRRRVSLGLASLLLIGSVATWAALVLNRVPVPDVQGLTSSRAVSILNKSGLEATVTRSFSETVAIGTVIDSAPEANEKARKSTTVTLYVSKGKERYIIPSSVIGSDPNAATASLATLTLSVSDTLQTYSDNVPLGKVVRTVPSIGSQVKRATAVTLVVSKGPAPVSIPALNGQTVSKATSLLAKIGLKLEIADEIYDDASVAGQIISTNPSAGTQVKKGATVNVTVSKGPSLIPVPNVVGMGADQAVATLRAAGFKVLKHNRLGVVVFNSVYSQNPASGSSAPRGSTVTIEIV
jgi:serine/threonine-protein kinase